MPKAALRGVTVESRPRRISRIAKALARRASKQGKFTRRPLKRKFRRGKIKEMIAYDLETTRIAKGTPRPLYLTGYGATFSYSGCVDSIEHLRDILCASFLVPELSGCRFVAWNGNNFDVFFIGAALLSSNAFILRQYLTRSKALRGIKVTTREKVEGKALSWEFLDGMSMIVGAAPTPLKKFLKTFAPEYQKLDAPDWEKEEFDPANADHVAYAFRDSEGLYHGLIKAQSIVAEHFEQGLQPTIGNLGIRIFQQHMPEDKTVWPLSFELEDIVRRYLMRGGYCFAARRYEGPVWKYDINQAYAAAMRDADLPAGRAQASKGVNPYAKIGIYQISAGNPKNRVPFYVRNSDGVAEFALTRLENVWVTASELEQLQDERWHVTVHRGYFWDDTFRMADLITRLESLRMTDADGPNGAQGTMMKAIVNNSYGKTVEELDGLELQMSIDRPGDDFFMYQDDSDDLRHIWCKIGDAQTREYHQPHIGAFITAHVRMVLRRAILTAPDAWLYSDTDCCFFSRPVALPIDPKKYGYWKIEAEGEGYRIITKKVYARIDGKEKKAKGLNIKRLTPEDFERWYNGQPPKQTQVQRQNFLAVMTGSEMYVERIKRGQILPGEKR
jgi:hypothetical protein